MERQGEPLRCRVKLGPGGSPGGRKPFDEWIAAEGVPAGQGGPLDDPDGDGFGNGAEFVLGTRAGSAAARPAIAAGLQIAAGQTYPSVALTRRRALEGITLRVEAAADTGFTTTLSVVEGAPSDAGGGLERVTYRTSTPTSPAGAWFFRIRVSAP